MTNEQIAAIINKNNARLEELLTPGQFVLNKEIRVLLKENEMLRKECTHKFDADGYCIYCGSEAKNVRN